jgi:hypothetical protein
MVRERVDDDNHGSKGMVMNKVAGFLRKAKTRHDITDEINGIMDLTSDQPRGGRGTWRARRGPRGSACVGGGAHVFSRWFFFSVFASLFSFFRFSFRFFLFGLLAFTYTYKKFVYVYTNFVYVHINFVYVYANFIYNTYTNFVYVRI